MKISGHIYFTPTKTFAELKLIKSDDEIYDLFHERIGAYYFNAAKILNKEQLGFSSLILIFSAIEYLAFIHLSHIKSDGDRFLKWIKDSNLFPADFAGRIYGNYRCGLVHEGKIGSGMTACYDIGVLFTEEKNSFVINPIILSEQIENLTSRLQKEQAPETKAKLGRLIRELHKKDLELD